MTEPAGKLKMSQPSVTRAVQRGEKVAQEPWLAIDGSDERIIAWRPPLTLRRWPSSEPRRPIAAGWRAVPAESAVSASKPVACHPMWPRPSPWGRPCRCSAKLINTSVKNYLLNHVEPFYFLLQQRQAVHSFPVRSLNSLRETPPASAIPPAGQDLTELRNRPKGSSGTPGYWPGPSSRLAGLPPSW